MVRFTNWFATGIAVVVLALGSGVVLSGCKSDDAGTKAPAAKSQPEPAKPAPTKGAAAPAGSKLAKVQNGMNAEQVQEIMGAPTGQTGYPTGGSFTPWGNYTKDTGDRVEYKYKGQGRVVFAIQRYGGGLSVMRVDYDPAEDGQ